MPVRTNAIDVASTAEFPPNFNFAPHIAVANSIVTQFCAGVYDDERLEMIERYLAGHFAVLALGGQVTSQSSGGASESVAFTPDGPVGSTIPGQTALLLDTENKFNEWTRPKIGGITWLGTERC